MSFPIYNPHLEIKDSLIPGANLGLFTLVDIPSGGFVDIYHGTTYTLKQYIKMLTQCNETQLQLVRTYTLSNDLGIDIVPWKSDDCYVRYGNDISLEGRICNAEFFDFSIAKDFADEKKALQHFPQYKIPNSHRQIKMCVRAICHIKAGDEIYIDYGKAYWQSEQRKYLKQKYAPIRRKYKRIIRIIKSKLENKAKYLGLRKTRQRKDIHNHIPKVAVWPSKARDSTFVTAQWSPSTEHALPYREFGLLDWDQKKSQFLILNQEPETLPHPATRVIFDHCVLPVE